MPDTNTDPFANDDEFEWWNTNDDRLGGTIYGILLPINLGFDEDDGDWDRLQTRRPGSAYAWLVGTEHLALHRAIVSLQTIQKMLTLESFPVRTRVGGNIGRDEWLHLLVDLLLFRFTAIRDQAFNLVAVLFQLDIDPRDVTLRNLERATLPDDVMRTLKTISTVGAGIRDERNARAHHARERPIGHESFFQHFSSLEAHGLEYAATPGTSLMGWVEDENGARELVEVESGDDYDFLGEYASLVSILAAEFLPECRMLVSEVCELLDLLADEFCVRYEAQRSALDAPIP